MKFHEVLDSKIKNLEKTKENIILSMGSPQYHTNEVSKVMLDVAAQVKELPDDTEVMRSEFISVLAQVPELVYSVWASMQKKQAVVEKEITKLQEMKELYLEWSDSERQREEREQELLEKIRSGEIKEPTKMESIRRERGTRPEVSIGDFRRAAESIEGEDSEE